MVEFPITHSFISKIQPRLIKETIINLKHKISLEPKQKKVIELL